jgi:acyl carrier protein
LDAGESKEVTAEVQAMARRLIGIMEREIDGTTPAHDDLGTGSITRLNLDSLALIGFLVAVEDEFGIEWDPDVDVDVMRSFDAMAAYVLSKGVSSP